MEILLLKFQESKYKSSFIHQFECKCSRKRWWGSRANKTCKKCEKTAKQLDLSETIGIGWFECSCGRIYAGFAQGNFTSKCHGCETENYPSFIVPGNEAKKEEKTDKSHFCAACEGRDYCPIVEKVRNISKNISKVSERKSSRLRRR